MATLTTSLRHALRVFAGHPGYFANRGRDTRARPRILHGHIQRGLCRLLKPLPYKDPSRLVRLGPEPSSLPRILRITRALPVLAGAREAFEGIGAWAVQRVNLEVAGGDPDRVRADRVTPGLFPLLGIEPVLERPVRSR